MDNDTQLTAFRSDTEQQIVALTTERKALSNEIRRAFISEERSAQLAAQISSLSIHLKALRRDVRLCGDILKRSVVIAEKQERLTQPEQDNKARCMIDKTKPNR